MKQAHKALDIPIEAAADDMQIHSSNTTTHNHGLGKLPALILGAGLLATGAGIPAAIMMAGSLFSKPQPEREVTERVINKESDVTVGPITVREE